MKELGLTNIIPTSIILIMVDHTWTKPLGQLLQIPIQIVGREYIIDLLYSKLQMLFNSYLEY